MHQIFTKSIIKQSIFLALLVAMMFSSASAVFADNVNNTLSNSQTIQDPSGVGSSSDACEKVSVYWFRNNATSYNAYRSTMNDLATAQKIMSNVSYTDPVYGGFIDTVQPGAYFYWIENVGGANIVPSFNNSTGVVVFPCATSVKPTITLKGDALMVLKLNDTFTDPGATASDQKDGDISSFVSVSGYVDTHISGSYTVTYTVTNSANLTTYAKRRVVIGPANMCFIDICAGGGKGQPVLVPPASYPDVSSDTQYYFDIRQATSRCLMIGYGDGLFGPTDSLTRDQVSYVLSRMLHVDITDIPATQTFTDVPLGSYGRPYIEAINKKGFIESCSSTDSSIFCPTKATTRQHLAVALAKALKLNLAGVPATSYYADVSSQNQYFPYIQLMAQYGIMGPCDSNNNFCPTGTISRAEAAGYFVNAYVYSLLHNGDQCVIPNTPPTITLIGANPLSIIVNTPFVDPGATATDLEDGNLTPQIVVTGTVSTTTVGTYTLTYTVTDSGGLSASTTRQVIVKPVVEIPLTDPVPTSQQSPSCTVVTLTWDASTGGSFPITYTLYRNGVVITQSATTTNYTDTTVSPSTSYTYEVQAFSGTQSSKKVPFPVVSTNACPVVDLPPVITVIGANPAHINVGEVYNDPGATALDKEDGDITEKIIASSTVNTTVAGTYTVIYTVSDSKGHTVSASRTVIVSPVIIPQPKGKITVCLMLANTDNAIATSSYGLPNGTFSTSLFGASTTTPVGTRTWNTTSFSPNKKTILTTNDSDCVTYDNLDLRSYTYAQLAVTGSDWNTAKYNSQETQPINNVFDFFAFSTSTVNANGNITLTAERPDRTVVIYTTYKPADVHQCVYNYYSDTTNQVVGGSFAVATYAQNPAWTLNIPGATWIWKTFLVQHPTQDETNTFTKTFTVTNVSTVDSATLTVGADNSYSVSVNGTQVTNNTGLDNFLDQNKAVLNILPHIKTGSNTISFTVTNKGLASSTPQINPAGLLYKLEVKTHDASCVTPANTPPTITLIGANPLSIIVNTPFVDPGATATDLEDGNLTPQIVVTGTVSTTTVGTYTLTYTVTDSGGLSASTTRQVIVTQAPQCLIPSITSALTANGTVGQAFSYSITASSTATTTLSYSIGSSTLPTGLSFANGIISGTPTTATTSTITLVAKNSCGSDIKSLLLTIVPATCTTCGGGNQAPVITLVGSNPLSWVVGTPFVDPGATAHDPEDGNITPSIIASSTVDINVIGTYTITYNVKDSQGLAATPVTRTVQVIAGPQCLVPVITSSLSASVEVNKSFTYTLTASSTATTTLSVATSTLPDGLAYSTTTQTISGTVAQTGTYSISLSATNSCGADTKTLVLTVVPASCATCGGGGGGGNGPIVTNKLTIFNESVVETVPGVAMVTWNTNLPATRRVAYGNISVASTTAEKNYGYTTSTDLVSTPTLTLHTMVISIDAGKTYYFRPISTDATDTALGKELTITRATGGGGSANSCYYLYDYLRKDFKNNPVEVKKLQVFLRDLEGFTNLQVTGVYDDATIVAVNSFQNKYKADILTPWGHTAPTGYTYILTKKKVNEIYCKTAFPVTALQQQEIDAFRHFLESLRTAGIDLTQPKPQETVPAPVLQNDVIGLATTTATTTNNTELTTLAGTSSTTQSRFANAALAFMAWPVTAWNLLWNHNWCGVNGCNYCSWLNLILIIIIIIILYFWYREWNNNRKLEDINKEIDLQ